ncbi:MAG: nucleotidyltransferase family protein, partial [Roseburia sp.]|nr:nucleotidyltransferase family protein [Roseburia sp.]
HSFSQFCQLNKSREVTYTRISRILLHLILQITEDTYALGRFLDYIPYLRILGFKKCNSSLLSVIKKSASVPMISKLADASVSLSPEAIKLLEKDIFAADLYEQTKSIKSGTSSRSEYAQEIVRI